MNVLKRKSINVSELIKSYVEHSCKFPMYQIKFFGEIKFAWTDKELENLRYELFSQDNKHRKSKIKKAKAKIKKQDLKIETIDKENTDDLDVD